MKVFEDIFSGDEVLSDGYDIKTEYEGSILKVTSKLVPLDDGGNIDIGCGNEFGGADDEEKPDENVAKVNNIIHNFCLEEYPGSKKDIQLVFKEKIALVKKRLEDRPDRLKEWGKDGQVSKFVASVFAKYEDCQFFMGKSYGDSDPKESMFVIAFWEKDDDTGETFFFFKDCLREVKV